MSYLVQEIRLPLSLNHRLLICTLLIINVHYVAQIQDLMSKDITDLMSFDWQK